MLNVVRILIGLIVVAWSGNAMALGLTNSPLRASFTKNLRNGCKLFAGILYTSDGVGYSGSSHMYIKVANHSGGGGGFTGKYFWSTEEGTVSAREAPGDEISASLISRCLGYPDGSVELLKNMGAADGGRGVSEYGEQDYLGFKFKLFDNIYEFALKGKDATTLTMTITDAPEEESDNTDKVNAAFMANRARLLIAHQPDLTPLLNGGSGSFSGGGNDDGGNLDFVSDPNKPFWLRMSGSWSKNGDTKSNYAFGAAGIHYKFNQNFLAGVMVEFDHVNSDSEESNVKGTGWLAGPYMVAKLPDQPLYFDARLLWGKSKNETSPIGTYTDTFDTERLLARLKISGDLIYDGFTLTPNVIGTYTTDNQESYTDSLDNVIASQKVTLGEVSAGLDFSVPIDVATGKFNLTGGIAGIYSHTDVSGGSSVTLEANSEYRGRVDLGFNYTINQNITVDFKTFYDGIGAQDQYIYGLDGGVKVKF